MNTKLFSIALLAVMAIGMVAQPVRNYQSAWTSIPAKSDVRFEHNLGKLPNMLNIYVTADKPGGTEPTSGVPYLDTPDQCLRVLYADAIAIVVTNACDYPTNLVQVNAEIYGK